MGIDRLVDRRDGGRPLRRDPCTAVGEAGMVDCPTQMTVQSTVTNAKEHNRGLKMDRWTTVGSGDRPVDEVENRWGRNLFPNVQFEGKKTLF